MIELEFGYNLLDCRLPPSRDTIGPAAAEAAKSKYASIWSDAIAKRPALVSKYSDALKKYMSGSDDGGGGSTASLSHTGEMAAIRLRDVPAKTVRRDLYHPDFPLRKEAAASVAQSIISWKPGAVFVSSATRSDVLSLITDRMRKVVVCCCGPAEALLRDTDVLSDTSNIFEELKSKLAEAADVSKSLNGTYLANYKRVEKQAPMLLIKKDELKVVDVGRVTLDVAYAGNKFCIRKVGVSVIVRYAIHAHAIVSDCRDPKPLLRSFWIQNMHTISEKPTMIVTRLSIARAQSCSCTNCSTRRCMRH